MKRTLLVTGGAGFIGTNFVYYWLKHHPEDAIVVLDALTYAGVRENLAEAEKNTNVTFVHGDICDEPLVEGLFRDHGIDTVVHFAAESHVDRSITGPDAFIQTNIVGTHTLLKVAKRIWLDRDEVQPHRFHHVSTDEVYGTLGPNDPPFTETTPYAPHSPYSASKAASDHLVRAYHETYGLETTITNCSNNYGPYQFPEKLIPLIITNILKNKPLPVYGDGLQIRDWLHVEDHCRGIELALEKGKPGDVYNIGGHNEWTNIDIVKLICKEMDRRFADDPGMKTRYPEAEMAMAGNSDGLISFVEDRLGHDRRYAIDGKKAMRVLDYQVSCGFEEGLKTTVQWYAGDWVLMSYKGRDINCFVKSEE